MLARAVIAAFLALMAIAAAPQLGHAWTHGQGLPAPAVICNIMTGVATGIGAGTCITHPATCNGVADDSQAFIDFNTWATATFQPAHGGLPIELFIPSGSSCSVDQTVACNVNSQTGCPFINITYVIVSMYGATLTLSVNVISLGGVHLFDGGSARRTARLATTSAGASCTNMVTPAQASIFTVGQPAMISGFDMQGTWHPSGLGFGFPPNPYYFENLIVSAVSTSLNCDGVTSGGSVSFTTPLANTYLSTWPLYDPGAGANGINDQGGPATLYLVDPSWIQTVDIRGGSIERTGQQTSIKSKTVLLTDVTMTGANCIIPSENDSWTNTNVVGPVCNLEEDKLVGSFTWNGGSVDIILFQSSSTNLFAASNLTITQLSGSPKKFVGSHVTIGSVLFGSRGFGRTNEWDCVSCTINGINTGFGVAEVGGLSGGTWTLPGQNSGSYAATMSGGIITIPNTHGAVTWAVPGTNLVFGGADESEYGAFQVTAVTQDATNTYVQTSLSGGFPGVPLNGGSDLRISVLGAPKFTCTACIGSEPQISSLTQAPAGAPLYSWQSFVYTGAAGTVVQSTFHQWGNLSQANFNVTTAFSGSQSFHLSEFDNWPVLLSNLSAVNYNSANSGPAVNMHSVGNRQVTPSGVTCVSGTCTGDGGLATLDAAGMYFTGPSFSGPQFSADASSSCPGAGCPSITVTVQTNQGVVNPPN